MSSPKTILDRRNFLRGALTLPVMGLGLAALTGCAGASGSSVPAVGSWKATPCSEKEPGEPLIVSGTIYGPDGRTPREGILLSVYQTDATGVYTTSGGDNRNTRIHGSMRTNAEGRYEFRTIKPGSYPRSTNAAHIHAYVSGPGYPEHWIDEYLFDDDRFVSDEQKRTAASHGSFSPVLKLTRGSDGILRGVRDIKLK